MSSTSRYSPLKEVPEDAPDPDFASLKPSSSWKRYHVPTLILLIIVSNIITWSLSSWAFEDRSSIVTEGRSAYASLSRDLMVPLSSHSPYVDSNETLRNAAWDSINIDAGMIAVPDDFVKQKNLPSSQRFVWDESKSVYLLNGHHTLHCVRAVYISLMEFWQGKRQSRRWEHVIHCVDQLRQEAICNADDTPRYSTSDDTPASGMGQARMCRSWEKLEEWARGYNACYRYVNQTASYRDFPQIERFVWCPEGSPYAKEVEKVFGHIEW